MNSTTLLREVVRILEHFSSQYPQEADRVFEVPLQWMTALVASDFTTGYDISDSTVQSLERDSDGRPLLELSPPTVRVLNLSQFSKLVQLAGERSLEEVRACLEENKDHMVNILGTSLAAVTQEEDVQSLVKRIIEADVTDPELNVRLFLLLHSQDSKIKAELLERVSQKVGPDSRAVREEVKLLERLCGEGEDRLLKSLRYMSDFNFANGCRSPPWRQLLGEICHLMIEPCDVDVLYITCSSGGVFLIEGIKQGGEIGYQRTSDFYVDLATLLKSRSQHFAENIDEQDFVIDEEKQEELPKRRQKNINDPEYRQFHNLLKYLKGSNQTATVLLLVHIMDFDLMKTKFQRALLETGSIQILVNLLNTDHTRCKIGALKILRKICLNVKTHNTMVKMGALQTILNLLDSPDKALKAAAAETLASMATYQRDATTVRQRGGIEKLVKLLDRVPPSASVTEEQAADIEVARCAALALWSCSKSSRNKKAIQKAGGFSLLGNLLKTPHLNMLVGVVGLLQELASEESYRPAIQTEDMIKHFVRHLKNDHDGLQTQCANAITKCAEDKQARNWLSQYNALELLVSMMDKAHNTELLSATVGAIWKCAISVENAVQITEILSVETLVRLLTNQPEAVLMNVAGALAELLQVPANRAAIRECDGIKLLVRLFTSENEVTLVNVAKAVSMCAIDPVNIALIKNLKGISLIWSLLQHPSPVVQAGAAWSLSLCYKNATDIRKMCCINGSFELLIDLLESPDQEVVAGVCAAIAAMSKDRSHLGVVSDLGVAWALAKQTNTTDDKVRFHLSEAIRQCSRLARNRADFAEALAPLVGYLRSVDRATQENTVISLYQLSKDQNNCLSIYENGAVELLIPFMGSNDEDVQEAAVHCVRSIRVLLANRKACAFNKQSHRTKYGKECHATKNSEDATIASIILKDLMQMDGIF